MGEGNGLGYKELSEHYEHLIRTGQLKPGQMLPTEPELAKMHGVARTTLRRAFSILVKKGLVTKRTWEGTFVAQETDVKERASAHVAVICRQSFGDDAGAPGTSPGVDTRASCGYFQIIEGVSIALSRYGRAFRMYFNAERSDEYEALERAFRENGDIGLIAIGVSAAQAAEAFSRFPGPVVLVDSIEAGETADVVNATNRAGMKEATLHLLKTTGGPLAFVGSQRTRLQNPHYHRFQGFLDAHEEMGLEFREKYHFSAEVVHVGDGRTIGRQILRMEKRPRGIVCSDDGLAFGVLDACREDVVGVPSEISIIGFGNSVYCLMTVPGISTVAPDRQLMGAKAVEILESRLSGEDSPPKIVRVPTQLVLRQSTIPLGSADITDHVGNRGSEDAP